LDLLNSALKHSSALEHLQSTRSRPIPDALTIRRDPQGTSGSFQVDVKLVPAMLHPGELRGTIRIHTSDPAFPEFVVPVSALIR